MLKWNLCKLAVNVELSPNSSFNGFDILELTAPAFLPNLHGDLHIMPLLSLILTFLTWESSPELQVFCSIFCGNSWAKLEFFPQCLNFMQSTHNFSSLLGHFDQCEQNTINMNLRPHISRRWLVISHFWSEWIWTKITPWPNWWCWVKQWMEKNFEAA